MKIVVTGGHHGDDTAIWCLQVYFLDVSDDLHSRGICYLIETDRTVFQCSRIIDIELPEVFVIARNQKRRDEEPTAQYRL